MELQHERGETFEVNSYENIRAMTILDTIEDLHGEPGYFVAEKDVSEQKWHGYSVPARHIHDERKLGNLEKVTELDEDKISQIESFDGIPTPDGPDAPEGVEPLRLKDVMPNFTDWSEYESD